MKRTLILLIALLFTGISSVDVECKAAEQSKVYVVMSSSAYSYHKTQSCRAVKNAKHTVKEVTLAEAKKMGRKPCGICCKSSLEEGLSVK